VEILKFGRPSVLFDYFGWPPPARWEDVTDLERLSLVAFALPPDPRARFDSRLLVREGFVYQLRFEVTARDVDTAVYMTELRAEIQWDPEGEAARQQRLALDNCSLCRTSKERAHHCPRTPSVVRSTSRSASSCTGPPSECGRRVNTDPPAPVEK
jgi:hypothetical protein